MRGFLFYVTIAVMPTFFIFFIVLVQVILLSTHWLTGKVIVQGLGLTGVWATYGMVKFFVLSFIFLISTVLTRYKDNTFSRIFYKISVGWMGLFFYLFGFSIILGLVSSFITIDPVVFALLLIIPVALTVYGILNANKVVVTRYSVSLPNLPEQWKGRKVVFISDTHFGQVRRLGTAKKLVGIIQGLSPDIVLHGGDFYDGMKVSVDELALEFAKINAPFGIYAITGNHESFGDDQLYVKALDNAGIKVLEDNAVVVDGLVIAGSSYKTTETRNLFAEEIEKLADDIVTLKEDEEIPFAAPVLYLKHVPDNIDLSKQIGNGIQMSGHTHQGQVWPFRYLTRKVFKGYDYGIKPVGDLQVITSSGAGTWGPPIRTFTKSEIVLIDLA